MVDTTQSVTPKGCLWHIYRQDEGVELDPRMLEHPGTLRPEKRAADDHRKDPRQDPSQRPSRDIKHRNDKDQPRSRSKPLGLRMRKGHLFDAQPGDPAPRLAQIKCRHHAKHHQENTEIGHSAQTKRRGLEIKGHLGLDRRIEGVGQDKKPAQVPAHMPKIRGQREACRQVVIHRKGQCHLAKKLAKHRDNGARRCARVKFFLDRGGLCIAQFAAFVLLVGWLRH